MSVQAIGEAVRREEDIRLLNAGVGTSTMLAKQAKPAVTFCARRTHTPASSPWMFAAQPMHPVSLPY